MARTARHAASCRSRWTPDDAKQILAKLERSGLPVRAFAARHGIDPQRLYRWRSRIAPASPGRRTAATPFALPSFTEVTASGMPIAHYRALGDGFEVALRSGAVVRVGSTFDPEPLRRLLAAVAEVSG